MIRCARCNASCYNVNQIFYQPKTKNKQKWRTSILRLPSGQSFSKIWVSIMLTWMSQERQFSRMTSWLFPHIIEYSADGRTGIWDLWLFSKWTSKFRNIQSHKGINLPIQCETVIAFLNPQQAGKVNYVFAGTGFEHVIVCLCNMENRLFKFFKLFVGV